MSAASDAAKGWATMVPVDSNLAGNINGVAYLDDLRIAPGWWQRFGAEVFLARHINS